MMSSNLQFGDVVITTEEEFVVTGWLQGSKAPSNTISIKRKGKIIYSKGEEK